MRGFNGMSSIHTNLFLENSGNHVEKGFRSCWLRLFCSVLRLCRLLTVCIVALGRFAPASLMQTLSWLISSVAWWACGEPFESKMGKIGSNYNFMYLYDFILAAQMPYFLPVRPLKLELFAHAWGCLKIRILNFAKWFP